MAGLRRAQSRGWGRSGCGLFIRTANPPGVGDIVKLFFEVPGGEVRARAVVCDSQPGRELGVEFTAMGPEDRARVDRLARRLLD